jgi:hypothetical protein
MVAGRGPFDHVPTEAKVLAAQVNEEPAPPSRFAPQPVPTDLDLVILRALHKSPDERFQNADEMRTELERLLKAWPESSSSQSSPPQETEHAGLDAEHELRPSAQLKADDSPGPAFPVGRRVSNLWLFLAAAIVTAAATAGIVAMLVGPR